VWKLRRRTDSPPPLTRFAYWASGLECTIDDSAAQRDLGYAPVITREQGLADMAEQPS
jgi:nucleoside-diphosphate-sugar epimerase